MHYAQYFVLKGTLSRDGKRLTLLDDNGESWDLTGNSPTLYLQHGKRVTVSGWRDAFDGLAVDYFHPEDGFAARPRRWVDCRPPISWQLAELAFLMAMIVVLAAQLLLGR